MTNALPEPVFKRRRSAIAQAAETEAPAAPPIAPVAPTRSAPSPRARRQDADEDAPPQARNKRIAGESKDILLSMPDVEKARMVNTIAHTTPRTGIKHQSKFIRYAVAKLCEELEGKYNSGEPFDPPAVEPI